MDGPAVSLLKADLFEATVRCVARTVGLPADSKILGVGLSERALRLAAEEAFRACARQAKGDDERYGLVDRANQVRPLTWV